MAIKANIALAVYGDLSLPDAYVRITRAATYKGVPPSEGVETQMAEYNYAVYYDTAARQAGKNPLDKGFGQFVWDAEAEPEILAACYAHLKAQDTYAAATDC